MNAEAATSIQKSAIPSKRAEIHATASALGANHANARPAATRRRRAPRASPVPRAATTGARPAMRWPREQDIGETPRRRVRAARHRVDGERRHRQRTVLVRRRADAGHERLAHARRDLARARAIEHLKLRVVVGQESAGQRRDIDDERRQRGQRERQCEERATGSDGRPCRDRTCDQRIKSPLLYQLS